MDYKHLTQVENQLVNQSAAAIIGGQFDPNEVLLPYQKRWIADQAKIKIAEKSRRTGLTWAEAADAALNGSMSTAAGGCDTFYVGTTKDMAREFIEAASMWAKAYDFAASEIGEEVLENEDKDILVYVINFASGFKIKALSSNPSNLRGMQGNVVIDEGAFHKDLAAILKAANALTMWGSKVRIISTHNGIENLFNTLIMETRAGKRQSYSIHRIDIETACNEGLYKRICQVKKKEEWSEEGERKWLQELLSDCATEEDAREEYYCEPKSGGGAYLPRGLRERACRVDGPVLRFTGSDAFNSAGESERNAEMKEWLEAVVFPELMRLDRSHRHALGEDFARTGDLTSFAPIMVKPDTRRRVPFLVELKNVPYNEQLQVLFTITEALPRLSGIVIDSRGNGSYIGEAAFDKYGAMVLRLMPTEGWYRDNMPPYKAAFEDDTIEVPKHDGLLQSHRAIRLVRGVPRMPEGKTADGGHGDNAMACVYAHAATRMNFGPVHAESRPRRSALSLEGY